MQRNLWSQIKKPTLQPRIKNTANNDQEQNILKAKKFGRASKITSGKINLAVSLI